MTIHKRLILTVFLSVLALHVSVHPEAFANPDPTTEPVASICRLVFPGKAITDDQGNFIGVTIPLKRAGRLLLIEGIADNIPGNFVLDTGAEGLVLNTTYFRNYKSIRTSEGGGITGTAGTIERIRISQLQLSEIKYPGMMADITPLGHLENRRGVKILGLIGMTLLKDLELILDTQGNELQIYRLDKTGKRISGQPPAIKFDHIQKILRYHNVMFMTATIAGKTLYFCLDTGAETNVLHIGNPKKVMNTVTITRRSNLRGVGASEKEVLYGILNEFMVGPHRIGPMETIITDLSPMSEFYNMQIDGMLGYDFFQKGKICINLVKQEIGICFNREEKK